MPQQCSICAHPDRQGIDRDLVGGATLRDIARRHGLSKDAVARHKNRHLTETMADAVAAQKVELVEHGGTLVSEANSLLSEAKTLMQEARTAEKRGQAIQAINAAGRLIELLAKLEGAIASAATVNVLVTPEWSNISRTMLQALMPYPEARYAVAEALDRLDSGEIHHSDIRCNGLQNPQEAASQPQLGVPA